MQAYNPKFSKIYDQHWGSFARHAAPLIREYYERLPISRRNKRLLDLCCGPGHLALHFLEAGYRVDGLDLSESMLNLARLNTAAFLVSGQVEFIQGDAANFNLPRSYGMVTSTFDALNHLPGFDALKGCFVSTSDSLAPGGVFIFDLNTKLGLEEWNGINVKDTPELMIINRGIYDRQAGRASTYISGFALTENGLYERFEESAYNTAFDLEEVRQALLDARFRQVHFARSSDLCAPLEDPEAEKRVFVVASR